MKIAIAGYGIEGEASYEYWNDSGNEVVIADERDVIDDLPKSVQTILGSDAFSKLGDFDLIVRSPSVNPKKVPYGDKVWSATNEFFATCPAPIIGVTGTKGKGTTCSLIASILRAAGKTVHLVGNIGTPALAELPKIQSGDIVVFELSSFQLWDVKKSPYVAVVLMIEPDHLDIHDSMDDYVDAKANIRRFQSLEDVCVYHPTNYLSQQIAGVKLERFDAEHYGGSLEFAKRYAIKDDDQVYTQDDFFCVQGRNICSTENLKLPGDHNLENACAAMSAVSELWLNVTDEQYAEGLRNFTGLPHRLKYVAEKHGVRYYDDSISTTPGSAIAAIKSFDGPIVLILGGHDKGGDYDELMHVCHDEQVTVIAIGENREAIAELCVEHGVEYGIEPGDMSSIVARAAMEAKSGVVVLSPAAASFDMFKNYADRGDQFIAAVEQL